MLIHEYRKISDQKVLKYSREDLGDFRDFMKAMKKLI